MSAPTNMAKIAATITRAVTVSITAINRITVTNLNLRCHQTWLRTC